MVRVRSNTQQVNELHMVEINYLGDAGSDEAAQVKAVFKEAGVAVAPVTEVADKRATYGPAEVVITIFVSAALNAVLSVSLKYLKEYLKRRILEPQRNVNLQIVVKNERDSEGVVRPFSMRTATAEAVDKFIDGLGKSISGALG